MGDLILKELLQHAGVKKTDSQEKLLYLFVGDKEYEYAGAWQWDLHCDAVFCSDVMLRLPDNFEGTRGIIHPDDKALVQERVAGGAAQAIPFLQFRIITTYGDIKVLTGRNLQAVEATSLLSAELEQPGWKKQEENPLRRPQKIIWQKRASELAERLTSIGSWYYNADTNEAYYSDEAFRIFGIPRQGLNAHLNTFTPFIHPDDRDTVTNAFTKAVREQLPLHLEYRITTPNGHDKVVQQATHWEFNEQGALMLYGTIKDTTDEQTAIQKALEDKYELQLLNRLLQLHEQAVHLGHWSMNLVTRKVAYSDNLYRLHGVKPGTLTLGGNIILQFVHPDDRDTVKEVYKKIMHQHTPPDIDYRIVRPDGKTRHLRQRGKLTTYGEREMVMLVTLQDITAETITSQKMGELKQQVAVLLAVQQQSEEMATVSSWMWEPETDKLVWSESLYTLLGTKPALVELTQKHLLRAIHPEDRKKFEEQVNLTVQEKRESKGSFRILRLNEIRYVTASFRLMTFSGRELFIGTLQDISLQERLQQEHARQSQLQASLTENMLDRAVITDTNNTVLTWNRQCELVYGLKKEAVLGKNIFDVLPQLKNETDLNLFNRALNGENIFLPGSKATLRHEVHDLHMIPLRDEEDHVIGILHLLHDVTRAHEMQQRLGERLNFIEGLMEASVDRILVMDRYMNYLYCNKRAAAFYGLRKEDLIGKNVLEVFPASVNDPTHDHFRKALKGDTVHIPAIEGISEEHYFEVFLIPIFSESNTVSAVLWIHHDLSSEVQMQKQLRKSDEILNNINAVFIEVDNDYRFKYLNQTAEVYYGKNRNALLGKVIWDEFPMGVNTPGYTAIIKAATERVQTQAEYFSPIFKKWVYLSVSPSADGVIILFYDRQDIKAAQQQLHEEHRRFEEAQGIGKIGSFEWTVGDEEVAWSDEMYRINGMEPQVEPMTIALTNAFIHPEDHEDFKKLKEAAFVTPGSYKFEHRIVLRDGTLKWVAHQFESIAGESGAIERVHGTVQDITERKKAEDELLRLKDEVAQKATDKYLTLFNSIDEGFYQCEVIFDEQQHAVDIYCQDANPASIRMTGIDLKGKRLREISPEYESHWYELFGNVALTGESKRMQQYAAHDNKWFEYYISKIGDRASRQVVVVFQDITERKRAEEALRESEQRFHSFIAASSDSIYKMSADWKIMHHLEGKNFLADTITDTNSWIETYIPEHERLRLMQAIQEAVAHKGIFELEHQVIDAAGTLGWTHSRAVPQLDERGAVVEWFGTASNITEQKNAEAALYATEKIIIQQQQAELFKNLNLLKQSEEVAGLGTWEYSIGTKEMSWSDGMYQLFDLKQDAKVKPQTYLDFAIKAERKRVKAFVKGLLEGAENIDEILTIETEDGTRKVIKIKGIVEKNREGKTLRMLGVDIDITELVQAEARLKALNRSLYQRNK